MRSEEDESQSSRQKIQSGSETVVYQLTIHVTVDIDWPLQIFYQLEENLSVNTHQTQASLMHA